MRPHCQGPRGEARAGACPVPLPPMLLSLQARCARPLLAAGVAALSLAARADEPATVVVWSILAVGGLWRVKATRRRAA